MTTRRVLLLSLLLTLVVWTGMTWPLARYVHRGIPASSYGTDEAAPRHMIAGDHLQLLYRFWLVEDMFRGKTPWCADPYQFNHGDDDARHRPGAYYAPFSIIYAALAALGGPALGWNLTGLLTLWLTLLCTYALVKPTTRHHGYALAASLITIALPYRYYLMMGGSPGGLALVWPPMLLLGMDRAVRRFSIGASVLAAVAIVCAAFTDTQVFLFMMLAAVPWLVWVGLTSGALRRAHTLTPVRWIALLAPPLLAVAGAYAYLRMLNASLAQSAHMAGGRTWEEVLLYAPQPNEVLTLVHTSGQQALHLGFALTALAVATLLAGSVYALRQRTSARRMLGGVVLGMIVLAGVLMLALGPHGPFDGLAFRAARHVIPPYRMLRQSTKIYCLVPTLLALTLTGMAALWRQMAGARVTAALLGVILLATGFEYRHHVRPVISLLTTHQEAYAAIVADAKDSPARALAIPVWPGDTHWGSLQNVYGGMLHRIRMVNGYSPVVDAHYYDDVFRRYTSMNAGQVSDAQLDALLSRGIRHVLLHEDAFPEKVSPFPVHYTLQRFLAHPRLTLLKQAEAVWAFRIHPAPGTPKPAGTPMAFFPARRFDPERYALNAAIAHDDPECSGSGYVRLAGDTTAVLRRCGLGSTAQEAWHLRVRGAGSMQLRVLDELNADAIVWRSDPVPVDTDVWQWLRIPVTNRFAYTRARLEIDARDGRVDLDSALFMHGPWASPAPGDALTLAANRFFHAGYTLPPFGAVRLRHDWEPAGRVFYGPNLPLETGRYTIELRYDTAAADGTILGTWAVELPGAQPPVAVRAGEPAHLRLDQTATLPVQFAFRFSASADLTIRDVVLRREPSTAQDVDQAWPR